MSKLITLHLNVAAPAAEALIGDHMAFAKSASQQAANIFKAALTGSTLEHINIELYKWHHRNLNQDDNATLQDEPFRRAAILQHILDIMSDVMVNAVAAGCVERSEAAEELTVLAGRPEVPLSLVDLSTLMKNGQAFLSDRDGTRDTQVRLEKLLSAAHGDALCVHAKLREGCNSNTAPYRLEVQLLLTD